MATLAEYRAEQGLTLAQTCVAIGLKPSNRGWLSEIERGVVDASIRVALKIERWSGGKVAGSSLCSELAEHEAPKAVDDAVTVAPGVELGALEKSGDSQ